MARSFAVRGVVEGFYGPPWEPAARREAISFLADRGMNAYVYAPKDDVWHRARWREPYPEAERAEIERLARHCAAVGVRMGFAVSPGLDIDYRSPEDLALLVAKLSGLRAAGADWFLLLLDDIPMRPGLAADQGALATALGREISATGSAELTICPTEYLGTYPSPYLGELARRSPAGCGFLWTGPTVCSPRIEAAEADAWIEALGGHRTLLWDNTPVNDATMTHALHLAPYGGRDPALADRLDGVLCNPMTQAHASLVPLATAMRFLASPDDYDAEAAWAEAVSDVGGRRARALGVLARACGDGPIPAPGGLPLGRMVAELEACLGGSDWGVPAAALADELRAARSLPVDLAPDRPSDGLGTEIGPWCAAAAIEARAGLAALRVIQELRSPASGADPEPGALLGLVYGLIARWFEARRSPVTVFGPRFAVYSAIRQRPDGSAVLAIDDALVEDANAIDRLCRLALDDYSRWIDSDGAARPSRPDGPLPFPPRDERTTP